MAEIKKDPFGTLRVYGDRGNVAKDLSSKQKGQIITFINTRCVGCQIANCSGATRVGGQGEILDKLGNSIMQANCPADGLAVQLTS